MTFVPINYKNSFSYSCGQTTTHSNLNLTVYANTNVAANTSEFISYIPSQNVSLFATVGVNTTSFSVYNSNGGLLYGPINSTSATSVGTLQAGVEYAIQITTTASISAAALVGILELQQTVNFTTIFPNIQIVAAPQPPSYVPTSDPNGNIRCTFTNYPFQIGVPLVVANTGVATIATNVIYTSSDTTVLPNENYSCGVGQALQIILVPLKTTSFTGTILISSTGSTTPGYVNTIALEGNPA